MGGPDRLVHLGLVGPQLLPGLANQPALLPERELDAGDLGDLFVRGLRVTAEVILGPAEHVVVRAHG
jgi:hypothetical protein